MQAVRSKSPEVIGHGVPSTTRGRGCALMREALEGQAACGFLLLWLCWLRRSEWTGWTGVDGMGPFTAFGKRGGRGDRLHGWAAEGRGWRARLLARAVLSASRSILNARVVRWSG